MPDSPPITNQSTLIFAMRSPMRLAYLIIKSYALTSANKRQSRFRQGRFPEPVTKI